MDFQGRQAVTEIAISDASGIRDTVQEKLPHFPKCSGVKALANHELGYRLRAGRYRVLFAFAGSIKLVRIEEVGKRNEHAY